ncbi:MAG: phosphatase PAP2 family protein [Myxococcota bacterium]
MTPPLGSWRFQQALAALTGTYALVGMFGWRDVSVIPAHWVAHLIVLGGIVAVAGGVRARARGLSDALVVGAWALWCNATTAPFTYAVMRASVPMRDAQLAAFDAALGLPVPRVRAWLDVLPKDAWWGVYDLLAPLLVVAIFALPLTGRLPRARVLLGAYVASFALALPVMSTVQAVGPWAVHGFPAVDTQLLYVKELGLLKTPGPFEFDPTRTQGVVTFPSFHTILAVLGGWALAPVRGLGLLGIGISSMIVLATVATGWHYVADVAGGLVLAALSIALARAADPLWGDTAER